MIVLVTAGHNELVTDSESESARDLSPIQKEPSQVTLHFHNPATLTHEAVHSTE